MPQSVIHIHAEAHRVLSRASGHVLLHLDGPELDEPAQAPCGGLYIVLLAVMLVLPDQKCAVVTAA